MIPHSRPHIGEEEIAAVSAVLRSGMLAQGAEVRAFEEACAAFTGRRHAVAVSSGTAALHLALAVLGVGEGDRVLLPSYACAALLHPPRWLRAEPILCDVEGDYRMPLHPHPETRAQIVAHLFGGPSPVPEGPFVIEDIAQSIGGATGAAGRAAVVSFYATKLMTTGEGGMLLTDEAGLADEARDRRDYDNRDDFKDRFPYKMTEFQAALGRVQLSRLPGFIEARREIAARYQEAFGGLPLRLPDSEGHVFFRYVVAHAARDPLREHLARTGVEAKRPVHRPLHHHLGGEFPNAERAHAEALSLPIYPAMTKAETARVIDSVQRFFDGPPRA